MEDLWELGPLPLALGPCPQPHYPGFPERLPFTIAQDQGRIVQKPSQEVDHWLHRAYQQGSMIGTPLGPRPPGSDYFEDFWQFLKGFSWSGRRVLEPGCGRGYLLSRLQQEGARCQGLEPGPQGQLGATEYGLEIVEDFFPSLQVQGPYDGIVHYCLLEHIQDPLAFLQAHHHVLSPQGRLFLAVPNCEPYLESGDLSIFVHQHWSYFTPDSLRHLLALAGFRVERWQRSSFGGLLYVEAGPGQVDSLEPGSARGLVEKWQQHLQRGRQLLNTRASCGVIPAARMLNLIGLLQPEVCPRLFDDDPVLHGQYFPPLPQAIESRQQLLARPVGRLILTSKAFGPQLLEQLQPQPAFQQTEFILL